MGHFFCSYHIVTSVHQWLDITTPKANLFVSYKCRSTDFWPKFRKCYHLSFVLLVQYMHKLRLIIIFLNNFSEIVKDFLDSHNILSFLVPCQSCRVPHKDCLVCQAYYKVYGKEFLQYRFGPDRLRSTSTPSLPSSHKTSPNRARARLPDSGPTSDDVAYSRPLSRNQKIFIPSNESEGYSSYRDSSSQSDDMHERVKQLLEKTKMYSVSNSSI